MANIENYGYVQAELSPNSKAKLSVAVQKAVPAELLYESEVISYIKGDVTDVAHLTVCYGIENSDLVERLKDSSLQIEKPESAEITGVGFMQGYQNEYFSIYVVPEVGKRIRGLNDWIRKKQRDSRYL